MSSNLNSYPGTDLVITKTVVPEKLSPEESFSVFWPMENRGFAPDELPGSVVSPAITPIPDELPGSVVSPSVTPIPDELPGSVVSPSVTPIPDELPGSVEPSLVPLSIDLQERLMADARTATINVTYHDYPSQAQAAFDYAVKIWESLIVSTVPITVDAFWRPLGPNILGQAGPNNFWRNTPGAQPNTWYTVALANQLAARDLSPDETDMNSTLSSTFNWYFGTDGKTPANQVDFVTVALHELLHGIGNIGLIDYNNGQGRWGYDTGFPGSYDRFIENGNGQSLLNTNFFPNPSLALGNQLTSNNLFFDGSNAVAANNGIRPKLYAPNPWQSGSSIYHLDESTYPRGNPNSLDTPSFGYGEAIHNPGSITLGILKDQGWNLTPPSCDDPIVNNAIPDQIFSLHQFSIYQIPANSFRDPQNGLLTYGARLANGNPLPAWITFNGSQFNINSDPSPAVIDITVTATNRCNRSVNDTFTLNHFDNYRYVASNPDLIRVIGTDSAAAISHYVNYGYREGRPTNSFNPDEYEASNPDLITAFGYNPSGVTVHYITNGFYEDRNVNSFNVGRYIASYDDLLTAYRSDFPGAVKHYIVNGFAENRNPNIFDSAQYLASYDDLIRVYGQDYNLDGATQHFINSGSSEGRSRDNFSEDIYLASYGDLIAAFGYNLEAATRHYIGSGFGEGRAKAIFDPVAYLNKYSDLQAVFGSDTTAATRHFIESGYYEGRTSV